MMPNQHARDTSKADLPTSDPAHPFSMAALLIHSRRNVSARRLVEPGPGAQQLQRLLELAAAAPDHDRLLPWRFILIPGARRGLLADAFAAALTDRDPQASAEQIAAAHEKAFRSPLLLIAVARLQEGDGKIPALEKMVSLGAAIQNILLGAHAMGFGSGLTSGKAMCSPRLRELLALASGEEAVCCINIGTVSKVPQPANRPLPAQFFTTL